MDSWEYKVVSINIDLNKYGYVGWEAVGISNATVLLKRRVYPDTVIQRRRQESEGRGDGPPGFDTVIQRQESEGHE
jgi:hypothetical protein